MVKKGLVGLAIATALLVVVAGFAGAVKLDLGDAVGAKGGAVKIPILLNSEGSTVVGMSSDILYDAAALTNPRASIESSIGIDSEAGKQVISNIVEDGVFRVAVLGLNRAAIRDGVIGSVVFDVSENAPGGSVIRVGNKPGATDAEGNALAVAGRDGKIYIAGTGTGAAPAPADASPVSVTISPASGSITGPIDLVIKVSETTSIENFIEDGFSVFLNGEDITSFLVNSGATSIDAERGEATLSVHGLSLPEGDYEINAYLGNLSGYIGHGSVKYSVAAD